MIKRFSLKRTSNKVFKDTSFVIQNLLYLVVQPIPTLNTFHQCVITNEFHKFGYYASQTVIYLLGGGMNMCLLLEEMIKQVCEMHIWRQNTLTVNYWCFSRSRILNDLLDLGSFNIVYLLAERHRCEKFRQFSLWMKLRFKG